MGYVDADDTRATLEALDTEFKNAGANFNAGVAVDAFNKAYEG
jgi:aspartate aminotransferase-like enzyme